MNFLFADGHVVFLPSSIDYGTYQAFSTRAGGEADRQRRKLAEEPEMLISAFCRFRCKESPLATCVCKGSHGGVPQRRHVANHGRGGVLVGNVSSYERVAAVIRKPAAKTARFTGQVLAQRCENAERIVGKQRDAPRHTADHSQCLTNMPLRPTSPERINGSG